MFSDRAFGGKEAEFRELFDFIAMHRKLDPDWINEDTACKTVGP